MIKIIAKTCLFAFVLAVLMTVAQMQAPVGDMAAGISGVEIVNAEVPNFLKPGGVGTPAFTGESGTEQLKSGITKITDWIRGFIGALAILMLVIGGGMYMTARGDESKMTKGKGAVVAAIIGLVIVALAEPIQNAVYSGGKGPDVDKSKEIVMGLVSFFQGFIGAIAIAMIIYGGFQIITARGDESKFGSGKKSLLYAVIGLFVVALADFAVNKVIYPGPGQMAGEAEVAEGVRMISGIINWALGFVGIVAVAIMIWGGSQMIIARGDESKYQGGKKTLTYAVIGLMLVIISYSIVGFVFNAIGGA